MIKLRTKLNEILNEIHPRVFHIDVKNKTGYPYLAYDLGHSYFLGNAEIFSLDIDLWDNPADDDTTEIETLANKVWKKLDHYYYIDDNMQFVIYRESRSTVRDDESNIKRRTLIFNLKYYDRSVN